MAADKPKQNWTYFHTAFLLIILVAMPIVAWKAIALGHTRTAWVMSLVFITVFVFIAGHGVLGVWRGALLDERSVISLSRFQMVLWTVIIVSAFFTAAIWNLYMSVEDPLAIAVPAELWILLGISTTSLVGTPLILSAKKQKEPADEEKKETIKMLKKQGDTDETIETRGLVVVNLDPRKARWSDMFTGDETGNAAHLEMSKVQMFFFTIVVVLAYALALTKLFADTDAGGFSSFPHIDESMVALLGISHAGYLVAKAVPRSKTK